MVGKKAKKVMHASGLANKGGHYSARISECPPAAIRTG